MLWFCNAHIILPCLESVRPIHGTHPAVHESALLMSAFNVSGLNYLLRVQGASTISSHYYHKLQIVGTRPRKCMSGTVVYEIAFWTEVRCLLHAPMQLSEVSKGRDLEVKPSMNIFPFAGIRLIPSSW
jgi:hypothetical protein